MKPPLNRRLSLSERVYGLILRLYPRSHREAYGGAMQQLFRDQYRQALRERHGPGLAGLWARTLGDTLLSAVRERLDFTAGRHEWKPAGLTVAGAAGVAALVGWVDLTASEMQPILLVVLVGAFCLAAARPARPWRWGLVVGLTIPLVEAIALLLGLEPAGMAHARAVHPAAGFTFTWVNVLESFVALVPAVVAALAGAALRRLSGVWRAETLLVVLALVGVPARSAAQAPSTGVAGRSALTATEAAALVDPLVEEAMRRGEVAYAALVIIRRDSVLYEQGYGEAGGASIDPEQTVFSAASTGKLFTATAVMQLADRGDLDLQRDVNAYLRRFQVEESYPEPITLAHLLTHTAGFEDRFLGALAPAGTSPDLGGYLAAHLPHRVMVPGQQVSYSNHGIALAGYVVEETAGEPFYAYVERTIFGPLGMVHSSFRQPLPDALTAASVGRSGAPTLLPYPAGSLVSTPADMGRFVCAHLNGGACGDARILSEEATREMHRTHFTAHPGLAGVAYGFFEGRRGTHRYLFHTGDGGHHSLVLLLPELHLGFYLVYAASDAGALSFRETFAEAFLARVAPAPPFELSTASPNPGRETSRFVGLYRMNQYARTTVEKLSALPQQIRVSAPGDGTLQIRLGLGGPVMKAAETWPGLFRVEDGTYVVFGGESRGRASRLSYASSLIGDPGGAERIAWYEDGALHLALLVFVVLLAGIGLVFALGRAVVKRLRRRPLPPDPPRTLRLARILSGFAGGCLALAPIAALAGLFSLGGPLTRIPGGLYVAIGLLPVAALSGIAVSGPTLALWRRRQGSLVERVYLSLVAVAMLGFSLVLVYWRLVGFQFG